MPPDGCSTVVGSEAVAAGVGSAIGAVVGVVSGTAAAFVGVATGVGDGAGCAVTSAGRRTGVATGAGVRAERVGAALGAGVGVATIGPAGVGLLSGAMIGPDAGGVGFGLGRVEGGRLKRSRLGSVCGPLGVVCATASAGSIAAPASHAPARFQTPNPVIPITPTDCCLNRRQTQGGAIP
jgi:hypothetical protein